MIEELERESGLELHDARLKRVVFGGLRQLSMDDVPIEGASGQRIDVGGGADGVVWVSLDESNGFIRLRAASVTMESALGVWSAREASDSG